MDEKIEFSHRPVLLDECIEGLNIKPDGIYVDGTAGGAGHSREIAKRLKNGLLIAIDQDEMAIAVATQRLAEFGDRARVVRSNFSEISSVCEALGIDKIDGILLDLGVSSYQLDTAERGFSYMADAELDMRMDSSAPLSAKDVVNSYSQSDLCRILSQYGEEKKAAAIARAIVKQREIKTIETTLELAEIIKSVFPPKERFEGKHPARRSFQAIRIEVNRELDVIPKTLAQLVDRLRPGGRLAVITFHSLEDRLVKECIKGYIEGCTCPRDFPVCVCGFEPKLVHITRKPITPSKKEEEENPRSRSAKLRVAEKR